MINRNILSIQGREQDALKKRLACQKTTPAKSERIGDSFVTWTAFEKSAIDKQKKFKCTLYSLTIE